MRNIANQATAFVYLERRWTNSRMELYLWAECPITPRMWSVIPWCLPRLNRNSEPHWTDGDSSGAFRCQRVFVFGQSPCCRLRSPQPKTHPRERYWYSSPETQNRKLHQLGQNYAESDKNQEQEFFSTVASVGLGPLLSFHFRECTFSLSRLKVKQTWTVAINFWKIFGLQFRPCIPTLCCTERKV